MRAVIRMLFLGGAVAGILSCSGGGSPQQNLDSWDFPTSPIDKVLKGDALAEKVKKVMKAREILHGIEYAVDKVIPKIVKDGVKSLVKKVKGALRPVKGALSAIKGTIGGIVAGIKNIAENKNHDVFFRNNTPFLATISVKKPLVDTEVKVLPYARVMIYRSNKSDIDKTINFALKFSILQGKNETKKFKFLYQCCTNFMAM